VGECPQLLLFSLAKKEMFKASPPYSKCGAMHYLCGSAVFFVVSPHCNHKAAEQQQQQQHQDNP